MGIHWVERDSLIARGAVYRLSNDQNALGGTVQVGDTGSARVTLHFPCPFTTSTSSGHTIRTRFNPENHLLIMRCVSLTAVSAFSILVQVVAAETQQGPGRWDVVRAGDIGRHEPGVDVHDVDGARLRDLSRSV